MSQNIFEGQAVSAEVGRYLKAKKITTIHELRGHLAKANGHRSIGGKLERNLRRLL